MKIAVADIETTGLSKEDLIVEIGITELDLETGERRIIYNELVKEDGFCEKHKCAWVFKNTSLKFEDVMNAKPLDKEVIQEIMDEYPTTAFNKKFDFRFLKDRGIKIQELPCAMYSATDTCKCVNKKGHKKAPNVMEAYNHFFPENNYKELHRGGDDSLHEAEIVYELYKLGEFKTDIVID